MFPVACFTSPRCTPLLMPLALGLLASTPAAAWFEAHLGWVYGLLTLVSVGSLVVGLRQFGGKRQEREQLRATMLTRGGLEEATR